MTVAARENWSKIERPWGTNQAMSEIASGTSVLEKSAKRLMFLPVVYFVGIFESPPLRHGRLEESSASWGAGSCAARLRLTKPRSICETRVIQYHARGQVLLCFWRGWRISSA